MGDLIDFIFNFFNFLDIFPTLEKHYDRLRDNDLHLVKRIFSFFIISFIVLFFIGFLCTIIFLIYNSLKN